MYFDTYSDAKQDGRYSYGGHINLVSDKIAEIVVTNNGGSFEHAPNETKRVVRIGFDKALQETQECLYPDVSELPAFKEEIEACGYTVSFELLSFGESEWQRTKVKNASIDTFGISWDEGNVGVENKVECCERFSSYDWVFVINDRVGETGTMQEVLADTNRDVRTLYMCRSGAKYENEISKAVDAGKIDARDVVSDIGTVRSKVLENIRP